MGIEVWTPRDAQNVEAVDKIDALMPDVDKLVEIKTEQDTWQALTNEIKTCQACDLCQTRQQAVVGSGNLNAEVLWVTEAPTLGDEQQNQAFADDRAALFDEMLRAMSLSREAVFMTHIVKCRPPDDRDPKKAELAACGDFLTRQIALIQPKLIISVGRVATQQLLQSKETLTNLRGTVHHIDAIPMVAIYHPAYLLRKLSAKSMAWDDMQLALTFLK